VNAEEHAKFCKKVKLRVSKNGTAVVSSSSVRRLGWEAVIAGVFDPESWDRYLESKPSAFTDRKERVT
jgi:hypothetical protein